MKSKKKFLHKILLPKNQNYFYPLSDNNLSKDDLNAGIKVLKSGRITMGDKTKLFEKNVRITRFVVLQPITTSFAAKDFQFYCIAFVLNLCFVFDCGLVSCFDVSNM